MAAFNAIGQCRADGAWENYNLDIGPEQNLQYEVKYNRFYTQELDFTQNPVTYTKMKMMHGTFNTQNLLRTSRYAAVRGNSEGIASETYVVFSSKFDKLHLYDQNNYTRGNRVGEEAQEIFSRILNGEKVEVGTGCCPFTFQMIQD